MTRADELGFEVDLSAEQFGRRVPYETFAALRRHAPVYWYEPEQYWVVSTYDLVGEVNRDPLRFSSRNGPSPDSPGAKAFDVAPTLIVMDPPRHTTYRRLVSNEFAPRRVNAWEDVVRELARELIEPFVEAGGGDFVAEVADLLPMRVVGAMLGIHRSEEAAILRRTNAGTTGSDPEYGVSPAELEQLQEETIAYADYLIDEHRSHPRDDLVDVLLDARVDGEQMSRDELRAWITLFIRGGTETTRNLLAHGVLALIDSPGELRKVVQGVDMSVAVEELLRWVSPVMSHSRWPLVAVDLAGQHIEPGVRTTLWMVSANRDPEAFNDPDRLDVQRATNKHDSFGAGGPHFCLGAGLARLEARVVFDEMRPHLEKMSLDGTPSRVWNTMFNRLKHLPVAL
jgi:cholest-4-en-3-one 26-monooxygenase